MQKMTFVIAGLLIVVGVAGFIAAGQIDGVRAPTALIPAYMGIALCICGAIAAKPALRMHAMHVAVLIGLMGFIMPAWRLIKAATGGTLKPVGAFSFISTMVLCAIFVVLCVRSFIAARKAREAAAV